MKKNIKDLQEDIKFGKRLSFKEIIRIKQEYRENLFEQKSES